MKCRPSAHGRFTTIEQKLSGVRKWYDKQLKNHERLANPLRNDRVTETMNNLEKQLGRAVVHKPKMLKEMHLRAVQGERLASCGLKECQVRVHLQCAAGRGAAAPPPE